MNLPLMVLGGVAVFALLKGRGGLPESGPATVKAGQPFWGYDEPTRSWQYKGFLVAPLQVTLEKLDGRYSAATLEAGTFPPSRKEKG